jgi:hypothetical protein
MATTTTNYGFDVPTSSDLVKNGATAISTLGQDLDTFLFRPFTRNGALNSAMNVWQRGTSLSNPSSVATAYGADRWNFWRPSGFTTGITMSRQVTGDTTNLPNIQYCARIQRAASNSSTLQLYLAQNFETVNSIPFAGKQVTLTYYARAGANFSAALSILTAQITTGTGTDQQVILGLTGESTTISANATLTTTWQRFTVTGTIASTATQVVPLFQYTPVGTAGANDYYEITGVQLEVGNQASPYAPATSTYATELAACQRYYWRSTASTLYGTLGIGIATSTTNANIQMKCPVTMRVTPTSIDYTTIGNLRLTEGVGGFTCTGTLILSGESSPEVPFIAGVTSTGLTQYRTYFLSGNNTAAAFVGFSAEL